MEHYTPTDANDSLWTFWREQVTTVAGHLYPEHGVLSRACAAAMYEAISIAAKPSDTHLRQVLTDHNVMLVMHAAQKRALSASAINNMRQHLEAARRVALGIPARQQQPRACPHPAQGGRIEAIVAMQASSDHAIAELAQCLLSDLAMVQPAPWPCPLSDGEWSALSREARRLGYTSMRWTWRELCNERIRREFTSGMPVAKLAHLIASRLRLDQIVNWTAPDVCELRLVRGTANVCSTSNFLGASQMPHSPSTSRTISPAGALSGAGRRVSKEEFKRRAAAARARQTSAPAPRDAELEQILATWCPKTMKAEQWDECRDLTHEIMRRATHIIGPRSFEKKLRLVADFVRWTRAKGYPQRHDALFLEQVIADYERLGLTCDERTRADYRSDLRALGARINNSPGAPTKPLPITHKSVKAPYTDIEVQSILRLIDLERDPAFQRREQVLVALGLGAGLSAGDIRQMSRADIDDQGDNGVLITVKGKRARQVWLRFEYETLLRKGIRELKPNEHVLARHHMGKDAPIDLFRRIQPLGDGPDLMLGRLRNTWLAKIMCEPIPIWTVLQASGLSSARTLADIADWLEPCASDYVVRGLAA